MRKSKAPLSVAIALMAITVALATPPRGTSAQTSTAETKFTFATSGERVSAVLQQWSSMLGIQITATPTTSDQIVALRLEEVSRKEAMGKLADALHATWQASGNHWYLNRTDRQDQEERDTESQADLDEIRKSDDVIAKKLSDAGPFDAEAAKKLANELDGYLKRLRAGGNSMAVMNAGVELDNRGPIGRAALKLRLLIPAEDLANLPLGVRVVYSTTPTKLQRQLPPEAIQVLQQVIQDQDMWAKSTENRPVDKGNGVRNWVESELPRTPFAETPTRALLAVYRRAKTFEFNFEILLATRQGHVVERTRITSLVETRANLAKPPAVQAESLPLILSDEVKSYTNVLQPRGNGVVTLTPEQRAHLLDPVKYDPLSLALGPCLVAAAKAKNENMVAVLTDRQWLVPLSFGRTQITSEGFLNLVRNHSVVTDGAGWLLVRSAIPAYDRDTSVDRTKLAGYLKDRAKKKTFTIEQEADWMVQLPRSEENRLPSMISSILDGTSVDLFQNETLLRFYGGMTPDQRSAATSDQGLTVSSFSAESMDDFNRMIFGLGQPIRIDMVKSRESGADLEALTGLGQEPTEALGAGIPPSARLRINQTAGMVAKLASSPGMASHYMEPRDLALSLSRQSGPQFPGDNPASGQPAQYLYGQARSLTFQIDFTEIIHFGPARLMEVQLASEDPVAYADLPADFRSQVDAQAARFKGRFRTQPVTPPVQSNPPP